MAPLLAATSCSTDAFAALQKSSPSNPAGARIESGATGAGCNYCPQSYVRFIRHGPSCRHSRARMWHHLPPPASVRPLPSASTDPPQLEDPGRLSPHPPTHAPPPGKRLYANGVRINATPCLPPLQPSSSPHCSRELATSLPSLPATPAPLAPGKKTRAEIHSNRNRGRGGGAVRLRAAEACGRIA
jgi:hypothetical protein